ncbi:MAG: MFS transporter [Pseudoclavibacter sp.]
MFSEFAGVSYDAMLSQVSTKETVGRTSGMGWGMGYIGSIVLLLLLLLFFIQGFGVEGRAGIFGIPSGEAGQALNIRLAFGAAAVWFFLFLIPVVRRVPKNTVKQGREAGPWWKTYVVLWSTVRGLARRDPNLLLFLFSSAVYRDGLAAVFGFGAILAVQVYGFDDNTVIYFAVAANLVAGVGTIAAGRFDDRLGPKPVVIASLLLLAAVATVLFVFPSAPVYFWIFGLLLCLFVGPVQAASRSYLMRATPVGHEGEIFGLYRTTGRAASFLTPFLIGVFTAATGDPKMSVVAIGIVLVAGLLLFIPVKSRPTQVVIDHGNAGSASETP